MEFNQQKKRQLSRTDKSSKGDWDKAIAQLCKKLNKKPDYYTTSSCAGRFILIKADPRKKPGLLVFRTHAKLTFTQIKKELEKAAKESKKSGQINFKQEPGILHVACKDVEAAQKLIDKAKLAGWKRSGIMATRKRVMCELMSTEHIELPIICKGQILVSDDFLKLLVKEGNEKLLRAREKIKKLEKSI